MCKVCSLWGVLSQKFLFCYACRPNFHHKYLTLSDPPLSACGEALISRHTCADRPEILKLEPRMRVFLRVRVGAFGHVAQSDGGLSLLPATLCCLCTWLQKEATAVEERLCIRRTDCCVSELHPSLRQLPLVIALRSDEKRKASSTEL